MITKVVFHLDQNEDGFPPISVEMLNAKALGNATFKVENAPFFTPNISYGDVVKATPTDTPDEYEFEEVVEQSQFTTLSIIIMDQSMDSFLMDFFRGSDCVIEYGEFGAYRVLAVAVPSSVEYAPVREQLQSLEDQGLISFAELAVAH